MFLLWLWYMVSWIAGRRYDTFVLACHARPPAPCSLPRRPPVIFFDDGGSTSRLLCAKPSAPTQIDEHEHDSPHVLVESHVVIYMTTDTYPIDSRARGVGWVAWFALALRERARLGGKCQKAP